MHSKKPVFFMLAFSAFILLIILIMQPLEIYFGGEIAMLFPKGWVAIKERNLLFIIQVVMLFIVIPVYILTFVFAWKFRADNPKGRYQPDLDDNVVAEYLWWGVPFVIVVIMGALTLIRTYELDPFKPLKKGDKTLTIQAVALQWKWLFIYPEEKIATVNFIQFPEKMPLRFEITADAPMNSFWIPQLGGQIYAMPSMKTELHLIADTVGEFRGSSANLSGEGFSGMNFIAKATTVKEYEAWVQEIKKSPQTLNLEEYNRLVVPSSDTPPVFYQLKESDLFNSIIMKYMHPHPQKES